MRIQLGDHFRMRICGSRHAASRAGAQGRYQKTFAAREDIHPILKASAQRAYALPVAGAILYTGDDVVLAEQFFDYSM